MMKRLVDRMEWFGKLTEKQRDTYQLGRCPWCTDKLTFINHIENAHPLVWLALGQ